MSLRLKLAITRTQENPPLDVIEANHKKIDPSDGLENFKAEGGCNFWPKEPS